MKGLLSVIALLSAASIAAAGLSVELDLDGTTGNGPDLVPAAVSDYVTVDVWVMGAGLANEVFITVCNLDGSLEFQGAAYGALPADWLSNPATHVGDNCWELGAFNTAPEKVAGPAITGPFLFATMTWHAAVDQSCDDLLVDLGRSFYVTPEPVTVLPFDSAVGGSVDIGGGCVSSSEENSWGQVKNLFR